MIFPAYSDEAYDESAEKGGQGNRVEESRKTDQEETKKEIRILNQCLCAIQWLRRSQSVDQVLRFRFLIDDFSSVRFPTMSGNSDYVAIIDYDFLYTILMYLISILDFLYSIDCYNLPSLS